MSGLIVEGIDLDALNYTIKVPYNGSLMTGGDSRNADLNIFYDVSFLSPTWRQIVLTSSPGR
jgi:Amt family ammonium transporter